MSHRVDIIFRDVAALLPCRADQELAGFERVDDDAISALIRIAPLLLAEEIAAGEKRSRQGGIQGGCPLGHQLLPPTWTRHIGKSYKPARAATCGDDHRRGFDHRFPDTNAADAAGSSVVFQRRNGELRSTFNPAAEIRRETML